MTADRLKSYIETKGISYYAFENAVGVSRGTISKAVKEGKNLGSQILENILITYPDLSAHWLLTGEGEMIRKDAHLNTHLNTHPLAPDKTNRAQNRSVVSEPEMGYPVKEKVMVVTQDPSGTDTIPIINVRAAANYLTGYNSQEYIKELDYITMPHWMLKKSGLYRFFTVLGDSMEPTFTDGQYILCRRLEIGEYDDIQDLSVHVLVLNGIHHSGIYIKRVKNRLGEHGFIRCRSDNRAHAPFNAYGNEILEIWRVEWYFTSYFPNLAEDFFNKYEELQHRIEDIEIQLSKNQKK